MARVTMIPLAKKGRAAPRPVLRGPAEVLACELESWPGVIARAHWEIGDDTTVNGADFYFGEEELGHIHLDGEVHVPMPAAQAKKLISNGLAHPFPWSDAWVTWPVERAADIAIARALFASSIKRARAR